MPGTGTAPIRADTGRTDMNVPVVQRVDFKVDTSRPRSRNKLRSKMRHVLAVASGMFPLMALFVYGMSLFQLPAARKPYYHLIVIFLACGISSRSRDARKSTSVGSQSFPESKIGQYTSFTARSMIPLYSGFIISSPRIWS